jgi:type IV pilus assembly protein PilX
MTRDHTSFGQSARRAIGRGRQDGVVLFMALLVMVVLMLAGIALIRSTDTATIVSGNLALEQAAISASDRSIESSIHALFDTTTIPDHTADFLAQNYYSWVRRNADNSIPEIPKVLQEPFSATAFAAAGLSTGLIPVDDAGNKSYYVIERMCWTVGAPGKVNCNLSSAAFGADPGTQHYTGLIRPGDAYYRVTIRTEGPRATASYAQAILK